MVLFALSYQELHSERKKDVTKGKLSSMESNLILFEAEVSVLSQLVCRLNACLNSAQSVGSIPLSR